MFISINPDNPQPRLIKQIVERLQQGGVLSSTQQIQPTELGVIYLTVRVLKRSFRLKIVTVRNLFSFICNDLAEISNYAQVSNFAFKVMKRHLPGGPYTFVLDATKIVPDALSTKQKNCGCTDTRQCYLSCNCQGAWASTCHNKC